MANNPKKMKDPTEAALSAIQEALQIRDDDKPAGQPRPRLTEPTVRSPGAARRGALARPAFRSRRYRQTSSSRRPRARAGRAAGVAPSAANDDRAIDRPDPAGAAAPPGAHVLHSSPASLPASGSSAGLRSAGSTSLRSAGGARPEPALTAPMLGRAGARLPAAGHLLLRARPHGVALAGTAADRAVDGRGRHAARRARDRRARIDRHRRPGDPPRSRRHGRRRRARAGARRRARNAGAERSRPRSNTPTATTRCASAACCRISPASATRWSARPSRCATPSTASISI